ncbi:MAG: DUF4395 domain-containing protein [Mycobacteriaceae bacterium]
MSVPQSTSQSVPESPTESLPPSSPTELDSLDVRGPRFAAWITTAVLAVVLILSAFSTVAAGSLLAIQAVIFALGAALGPRQSPYGRIFATFVAPRISAPTEREPVAPLRFAQLVGLIFAFVGVIGFATDLSTLGQIATGFALIAAFLNAAFALCLGCLIYPFVSRVLR